MKMKRIVLAALLAVSLLLSLPGAAFADEESFNAYLEVTENPDGSVSVTIPNENAAVLTAKIPTLSIPCTMLDPAVSHDGAPVTFSVENGMVSFPVSEPGLYTISDRAAATLLSYSLTLEGQIGLNYRVRVPAELQSRVHAVLSYKGQESSVALGSPLSGTTDEFRVSFRVPAKEIGNPVAIRLEAENGQTVRLVSSSGGAIEGNTARYSVADYCKTENIAQLVQERGAELEALVAALQNYGAYALSYFGSADTAPGFASSGEDVSGVSLSGYDVVTSGQLEGLNLVSMFLTLESETAVNLRFTLADGHGIDEYSFRCGEAALDPEANNGSYLIRLLNIPAKDLDEPMTVTVTKGQDSFTVTCSALSYAQLVLNNATVSQNAALCSTVKALYLYNQAANAYFRQGG